MNTLWWGLGWEFDVLWRFPVTLDKSFNYWQSDQLNPSDCNMTKWMTHSFRLQQNKRDDRVKPKMLNLDIYLILHWTSSWFYLMSMMKRLTNSTNLLSLSSRSLFLEWLMFFMEWTIDTPGALQCFMRLLPKPVERKAKITILKKNSCYSSLINAWRFRVSNWPSVVLLNIFLAWLSGLSL